MDIKKILPGQNWEHEIDLALKEANVIIAWLSRNSVSKRGFVQREANFALDSLKYKLPTDIYFIPVLLEACEVPTQIASRTQYIDINTPNAWEQILASLRLAATQQSIALDQGTPFGPYSVISKKFDETENGHPGYIIDIEYPHFSSTENRIAAEELSAFFEARARTECVANRHNLLNQDPIRFPDAGGFSSNNGYWEYFQLSYSNRSIISIIIGISNYGAGAAHPNHGFESFNFVTGGGLHRLSLDDFFQDPYTAEERLSELCIERISREYWNRTGEVPEDFVLNWIRDGCKPHEENFSVFSIGHDGLTFHFGPYHVAAYALSNWEIFVSFFDLLPLLKAKGPYSLID